MKELIIEALTENLSEVIAFVDEQLEAADCPVKSRMQIDIAVEEIFVNIANYAYGDNVGIVMIRSKVSAEPYSFKITFIDNGVSYDPLSKPDPDVTLSAEDRQIGGLGIYMVKKNMDSIDYQYLEGQNILTLTKRW
jgi:anti-sigma regulatory factor (Ser/Thr protein kinase)